MVYIKGRQLHYQHFKIAAIRELGPRCSKTDNSRTKSLITAGKNYAVLLRWSFVESEHSLNRFTLTTNSLICFSLVSANTGPELNYLFIPGADYLGTVILTDIYLKWRLIIIICFWTHVYVAVNQQKASTAVVLSLRIWGRSLSFDFPKWLSNILALYLARTTSSPESGGMNKKAKYLSGYECLFFRIKLRVDVSY